MASAWNDYLNDRLKFHSIEIFTSDVTRKTTRKTYTGLEFFGDIGGLTGFMAYFFSPWVPVFAAIRANAIMANIGYEDPKNRS